MSQNKTTSGGTSTATVVLIVFLVLKLTKVIDWSWWWVTAPLWGGIALALIFFVIYVIVKTIFKK